MTFMKTWTSSTITTTQRSLNVSLGKKFTEGNLYFGDMKQVPLSESVYRGRAGNDRGSPIQRTTHARCPAHLLWPVLEPHCLDEGLTGVEKNCAPCAKRSLPWSRDRASQMASPVTQGCLFYRMYHAFRVNLMLLVHMYLCMLV